MTEAVTESPDGSSDAALLSAVRRGDVAAYGLLYQRHVGAARRVAGRLVGTAAEQEDLVAEAFTRVLRVLRTGRGPVEGIRPYLLVTMRHMVINWARQKPVISVVAEVPEVGPTGGHDDAMTDRLFAKVAADAFASLPQRWRMVLWHIEIEGESPAEIAPLLGLTPNGVSALAYRARQGLRQAYLEQHLPTPRRGDCQAATGHLAGWVRGSPVRKKGRLTRHLDQCADCRQLAAGLQQLTASCRR